MTTQDIIDDIVKRKRRNPQLNFLRQFKQAGLSIERDLAQADLSSLALNGIDLSRAVFDHTLLGRTDLSEATLDQCHFLETDLRYCSFFDASLTHCFFRGYHPGKESARWIDMRYADLRHADLSQFSDAPPPFLLLQNAILDQACLPPGWEDAWSALDAPHRLLNVDPTSAWIYHKDQLGEERALEMDQVPVLAFKDMSANGQYLILQGYLAAIIDYIFYMAAGIMPLYAQAQVPYGPLTACYLVPGLDLYQILEDRQKQIRIDRRQYRNIAEQHSLQKTTEASLTLATHALLGRDYEAALPLFEEVEQIYAANNLKSFQANIKMRLGVMAMQDHTHIHALRYFRQARDLYVAADHDTGIAWSFLCLALVGMIAHQDGSRDWLNKSTQQSVPSKVSQVKSLRFAQSLAIGLYAHYQNDVRLARQAWSKALGSVTAGSSDFDILQTLLYWNEVQI